MSRKRIQRKNPWQPTPAPDILQSRPFSNGKRPRESKLPTTNDILQTRPFSPRNNDVSKLKDTRSFEEKIIGAEFRYNGVSIPAFAPSIEFPTIQREEEVEENFQEQAEAGTNAANISVFAPEAPPPSSTIQRECGVDESCREEPNASYLEPSASYLEPNYTPAAVPNYTPAQANAFSAPLLSQPNQKQNQAKAPTIDPAKIKEAADAIFKAVDGWGTDEDAIMKALAGKTPEEIAAIKKEYADHYNGRNLEEDVQSELSGDDLKEAKAHLSGDRATAAVEALSNSIGVFNDDEEKIEETLTALSPEDIKKMQEMADQNPAVKAKLDQVIYQLGGEDKETTEALLKGNKEEASAVRIAEAIEGMGTDEKAVYKYLEGKTPEELDKIKAAYLKKTGRTLDTDIEDDFSDAEKDRASALASGDKVAATAAQIKEAGEGIGTDEKGIYDQLKGKSAPEREAIIKAYEDKYGKGSFDAMLGDELSDNDLKQAQQYRDKGELDSGFALKLGIEDLGTDEDLIKETLKGKTADEIKGIREAYFKETGRDLDIDLAGDVDGRDAFEIGQMLKGKPQTPQEEYERAQERYEFERGEGSTVFSRAMMDSAEFLGMHSKGEMLEYQTQRLQNMFDENGKLKPDFTEEDVKKIAGYQETDATNYKNTKEAVGNAVATAGTIAVAALVTVCTKGAAAPWLIAVISGLASGGANMAIKYGMQGAAYGGEDIAIEAVTAAITAAIGGSLAEKTAFLAKLDDIAKVFGDEMAKKVALEALKGTIKGATSGAIQEVMNDNNWREGIAEYLAGIGKGAALGGVISGTTAAASAGVKLGLDGKASSAMTEGIAGIAGGVVNEGVSAIKGDYKGRLEDLLGRLLVAGVSAAAEDKATSLASQARMSAIAKLVVAAGDDMPKVQQILEAQVKYLSPEDKAQLRVLILSETLNKSPDMRGSSTENAEPAATRDGGRAGINEIKWGKPAAEVEQLRRELLQQVDINQVKNALLDFGIPADNQMIEAVKRYNFDSSGISFTPENYSAWKRLSKGNGTVNDARYLIHEMAEVKELQNIQQQTGFDFMGSSLDNIGRKQRRQWGADFEHHYMEAHSKALAAEYDFIAQQVAEATNNKVNISRTVAAAADPTRDEARLYMLVNGVPLSEHKNFQTWRQRATERVEIGKGAKERLGLYQNPTLAELIDAVKRRRLR